MKKAQSWAFAVDPVLQICFHVAALRSFEANLDYFELKAGFL
jgi:hypothetical protein